VLRHIDAYYSDQRGPGPEGVATQLARITMASALVVSIWVIPAHAGTRIEMRSASITSMIRHYVARRAKLTEGHPHNA
jgi:hypothetical protein